MKIINPYAKTLSGSLLCPYCHSNAVSRVESTNPNEVRYRCKKCGGYLRYQYRYKPQENDNDVYYGHTRGLNFNKIRKFFGGRINHT